MIEVETQPERVLLMGVQTEEYTDEKFATLMTELVALTETAGGNPVKVVTQKLSRLDGRSAVGSGKLQEIVELVNIEEIELVISLNPLSPSSTRHIQEAVGVRVIDRIQLILDIFALRAKSREGKLQVELAQYDYLLPRLHGQGKHLSRLGAGIGTRGPGETKLESDRRHIRGLMQTIKKELAQLAEHRERTRLRRQSGKEFNIGLVGYTNAGKSTLLTRLTLSDTYVQDQLFATLDPLTRQMNIHGHDAFTLTDTVGFIEDLPTTLIHAFKSTLEEMRYVDLLLHVVDASNLAQTMHEQTVLSLLKELEMEHIPMLTVYNKADRVSGLIEPTLFPNIIISAQKDSDIERLKDKIWQVLLEHAEHFTVEIQPEEADLLALYRQKTLVESVVFDEDRQVYILEGYRRKLEEK
ncbi:GTPase HflX [Aerococcaceae bacterium NML210727]|nr:GTPase HflX [Aerococcaceae bacterium NML210727]MCW6654627.1 GTPase HflX [Aerococcaceae bacterium NML201296]MCW6660637.1 GTPase HflX [Aerococcaceae bacterium NML201209]MCW6663339.1 GTPase HflX [Aerococcaceae bacterium NML190073]MCW6674648.1 GTPase HflX [Aerococcaceae bacterium NML171108]MCW6676794.1 GTPase HflX [Aerococcaceae bacterium NML180378]